MIKYLTTIQLKDAAENDYAKLDIEMGKEAFAPLKKYPLAAKPSQPIYREYKYSGGKTFQEVTAAAYRASNSVGKKYSFTIMKDKA